MKHIIWLLLCLPILLTAQTIPQANNVPWYEFSKKLSAGKIQLKQAGEFSTDQSIPVIAGSILLDTITANRTVTFLDGSATTDKGVILMVENVNNSAFYWLVSGNVKEGETGIDYDTIPRGLHTFRWNGSYWTHQGGSGGSVIPVINAKINKFEIFKSFDEFRATTSADTGVIYHLRLREDYSVWKYVPSDATSADDTCTVVVSASGKRYYRQFNNYYTPEAFGANGRDAIDDTYALQRMIRYINSLTSSSLGSISIYFDPRANYLIAEGAAMDLGFLTNTKRVILEGNGCKITGNTIFKRRPPVGVGASQQGMAFIIRNFEFQRTGTATGSIAVDLGSTYSSVIEMCDFIAFDTAVTLRFALNTIMRGNKYTNNTNAVYIGYGSAWGGTTSGSQSNGTVLENERIFNAASSNKSVMIEAASDVEIRNIIIEGSAPDYGIYFDDRSATVVEGFKLHGMHFETVPVPDRAAIYLRGSGIFEITDIYVQVADTFLIVEQSATLSVSVKRFDFWPSGIKIASTNAGTPFYFEDIPYSNSGDFADDFFVNSGVTYVQPNTVTLKPRASGTVRVGGASNPAVGFQDLDISSGKSMFFQPDLSDVRLNNINLRWTTHNTNDIGHTSLTAQCPRYIVAGSNMLVNSTDGTYRWGHPTSGMGLFGGTSGVMRFINGSGVATSILGAIGGAYSTTANRPASPFNGMFRMNSDSINVGGTGVGTGAEFYAGTTWRTAASRLELINTNTLIQTQIAAAGFTDKFSISGTNSRTVTTGQTVYEIHLKSNAAITIDLGTSAAGTDIADDFVLASGVTRIIPFIQTADSDFSIHFTYVTGTGNIAVILVKKVL